VIAKGEGWELERPHICRWCRHWCFTHNSNGETWGWCMILGQDRHDEWPYTGYGHSCGDWEGASV
jgi:hypothetical protein